jgi:PQQ-dependent dehydrogenase (methanol/ethanol family)
MRGRAVVSGAAAVCKWTLRLLAGMFLIATVASAAAREPPTTAGSEWHWLGGSPDQWQYSGLQQIDTQSVRRLGLAWYADMPTSSGLVGNPLIAGNTVYQSGPDGRLFANDLQTGATRWTFTASEVDRKPFSFTAQWASHFNRGLALDDRRVYFASGDCRVFAVDRRSGQQVWEVKSCDPTRDYGIVGAPRLGGGKLFIGNTNTELGTERGFVDAFNVENGKHLWRFYTIPGDPAQGFESPALEKAAQTWGEEYWKRRAGSANVWEAITYDQKLNLVYLGVGNPAPMAPTGRAPDAGAELYSNCIVALKADTGEYVWHYQLEQHDGWDADAAAHIMVADLAYRGAQRRVVMQAAKNGFFYLLDARTGKLLSANNYVPNNWATHVDVKTGELITRPEGRYWEHPEKEVVVQPGTMGAHSWTLMAYNPTLRTVFIPGFVWPMLWHARDEHGEREKDPYYGLSAGAQYPTRGKLIAWDPVEQREKWHVDRELALNGGVLATAGDVVFQGTAMGTFDAFRAQDGTLLWSYDAHAAILSAPSTVEVGGEQLVLVAAGDAGATVSAHVYSRAASAARSQGASRLLAFRIGGTASMPTSVTNKNVPRPFRDKQPVETAEQGRQLFAKNGCYTCHGFNAEKAAASIPDLRFSSRDTFAAMHEIVIGGLYRQAGMPAFPHLTDSDLNAIQAFVTNEAWAAYESQQSANGGR